MSKFTNKIFFIFSIFFAFVTALGFLSLLLFASFFQDIPDYEELANYMPSGITRLYDSNGEILDEYALEKRVYVRYDDVPKIIINAFIAAEDKNFFEHQGIDLTSILRASLQNILNIGRNKRLVGGSTITQQVVKGFFLTNERSFVRKLKEAILAYRVSKAFTKEKILEIYLNQIYLGHHSYGIYVASHNYFGKSLADINIEEAALLASLPKAPSTLNPYKNYDRALQRRNWAIQRMEEEGFISFKERVAAINSPIQLSDSPIRNNKYENYYTGAVKSELIDLFDEMSVYSKGLIVNTNINLDLQINAQNSLRNGLKNYDKKRGWRGALAKIEINNDVAANLKKIANDNYHDNYLLGTVSKINKDSLNVILQNSKEIKLTKSSFEWILNQNISLATQLKQKFKIGDVILIDEVTKGQYALEQIPKVNGGMVVIENISGKILALVGGYDYKQSKFDRVIQAQRQPGSAFKTFLYLAAFEQNIPPNTLVLDEPLEIDLGKGMPIWKPKNHSDKYYGLITIRTSFEKSRNLSTLRLVLGMGLEKLTDVAKRYLIYNSNIKPNYSIALGAYETTLLKMTNAYASIGNNGVMKQPKLIDSVYNRHGELLYSPKDLYHKDDTTTSIHTNTNEQKPDPEIGFLGKKVTDDSTNYQILSLLEGVIQRGSAQRAKVLQRTVAGKTGTTNDSFDTWFIGMTPDITVGVFVGYDIPKSMGKHATGSNVALPIFIDFFKNSKFIPDREFEVPNSISKNFVDQETGNITEEKDFIEGKKYILENFKDITSESIYTDSQLNTKLNENIESLPQSLDIDTNSVFSILENEEQEIVNDSEDTDEEQNER
jgi:penicillin-binding protein 1A